MAVGYPSVTPQEPLLQGRPDYDHPALQAAPAQGPGAALVPEGDLHPSHPLEPLCPPDPGSVGAPGSGDAYGPREQG